MRIIKYINPPKGIIIYKRDLIYYEYLKLLLKDFICLIDNPSSNKFKAYKNVSGIYMWFNRINNKIYTGSSINLYERLRQYYKPLRLKNN